MPTTVDLFVPLDEAAGAADHLANLAERALGWPAGSAAAVRVVRRSLDARRGHPVGFRLRCLVTRAGEAAAPSDSRAHASARTWPTSVPAPRAVVIGSGPAGSWAALRLAEA